ncbi:MAG: DoxX family protein [Roseicyclus sp.]|jgi:uncharacterized membrane protein YphA (DoxX/SURF4 family)|nr:DoxX family protein [Roseicyclus sp.]MBO6626707.1 DoxX family protein [Roseicyclus sp.]MBO6924152.1 DoxX family protein [Roseicyclus sp.]
MTMNTHTADRITLNSTAQNLLRIVIASYFLAVGLNLIPGTSLTPLLAQVAPEQLAAPLASLVVFSLAFLVMIGLYMRPAALILGMMTFLSSYLTMLELGVADELGAFWRDLVLVAALMLTYAENAPRDYRMRKMIRHKVTPRRVVLAEGRAKTERPAPIAPAVEPAAPAPMPESEVIPFVARHHRARVAAAQAENIFADLEDTAIAS